MTVTAKYVNAEQTAILVTDGDMQRNIPVDPENRDYVRFIASGVNISDYQPPAITPEDVFGEANRRKRELLGVSTNADLDRVVSSGTREAVKLLRIGADNWGATQATRAAELEALEAALDNIDQKAAALIETEGGIPTNYQDNSHW